MRNLPTQNENNIMNTIGCTLSSIRSNRYKACGLVWFTTWIFKLWPSSNTPCPAS